jgi:thioredoxin reductase (NADPH)
VIVATGATARQLGLESERALHGRASPTAPRATRVLPRREVVVVGGGDSAMEEALYLTKFASKVTLVHRRDEFRASQIMVDRVKAHEKIELMTPFVVEEVLGADSGKLTGVLLRNVETGDSVEYATDGLFVAIGHDPTTKLFVDWLDQTRTAI